MEYKQFGHMQLSEDGKSFHFNHIYGNRMSTEFCDGKEKHTVYQLTFTPHQNQEIDKDPIEYWGWLEDGKVSMIYAKHFLLNMCFPSGVKAAEATGRGKAIKLELEYFINV